MPVKPRKKIRNPATGSVYVHRELSSRNKGKGKPKGRWSSRIVEEY
jgi:hypothetical protein